MNKITLLDFDFSGKRSKSKFKLQTRVVQVTGTNLNIKRSLSISKIVSKKMPKNFDLSVSWRIKFNRSYEKYVPFESACFTEFKTDLGLKIGLWFSRNFESKSENLEKMTIF